HTASWRSSPPLRATRSLNVEVGCGIPIPRTAVPVHAVGLQNAPLVRQSLCGFLVLHDCSVAKRVSGHLICNLVRDRLRPQMRFAVGTRFFHPRGRPTMGSEPQLFDEATRMWPS